MTEQEIARYVESLAGSVVPGEPPVGTILADAARVRRRRTGMTVVAAVAAVAVVVGLAASLGGGPRRAVEPADDGTSAPSVRDGVPALEGSWVVTVLVADDGSNAYHDPEGTGSVRLTLEDGQVTGSTGCNSLFGQFEQSGRDVRFKGIGTTQVGCMKNDESPVAERLGKVRHISWGAGNQVQLNAANGMILVVLVPEGQAPSDDLPAGDTTHDVDALPTSTSASSPLELCRGVALRFAVSMGADDAAPTTEQLGDRWARDGSYLQEINEPEQDRHLISLGSAPGLPTVVLEAAPVTGGWAISGAWACLDPSTDAGCGPRIDDADGTPFRLEPPDPSGVRIGVGRIVGQGSVPACARFEVDGTSYGVRGAFAPVTLFSANEMPVEEELTTTVGGDDVRRLHPVP